MHGLANFKFGNFTFPCSWQHYYYNKVVNIYIFSRLSFFFWSHNQWERALNVRSRIKWRSFACLTVPPLRNFCVSFIHNIWASMEDAEVTCHFTSFVLFNIFVSFVLQSRIFSTKASQSRSGIPDASTIVMAANKTRSFMRCLQHFFFTLALVTVSLTRTTQAASSVSENSRTISAVTS